ncbi:MAG TPA: serine/threonine-protein kinase [Pyrinomonadaceae bacterium]|nr:serine/threonine-protein kinase [Pyrinomonadaceae bacterium]
MTPERWQKVDEVLQAALDLPATERAALLAEVRTGDPELHEEALSLIEAHQEAGDFLEAPALETDAHVLLEREEPDREIGPYKIIDRLGKGGMGEVFLAQDRRLGRLVALKTLPSYFVSDDERLRRFQTEARAASALNHPNILTIYEVGESGGTHFIAAEHIEGHTLRELISAGELTLGEVLEITAELLTGLSAAHAAGIIHRDIKPENIMRRADGSIKILDFGIAKLMEAPSDDMTASFAPNQTQTGALMGTIGYVSPEQVRGLPVDERTDIWSCGVVLHEMLTGERPFAGVTNADTIVAILDRPPASLFVSNSKVSALRQLHRIVSKALSKEAEERHRSAAEMLEELRTIKRSLGQERRPVISGETTVKELRTFSSESSHHGLRRYLVPAVVAIVLLMVAGLLYRQFRPGPPNTPPPPKTYAQMNEAEQLAFVSEQEQRISAMMGERPMKLNDDAVRVIKSHVDYHVARRAATTPANEEVLAARYERAKPYIPVISRAFAARRIPVVVGIYLAMFESAYQACPENEWGARGMFQFLPQTAERYGVARADMCDVNKMAPAAAHYIADRMAELGDDSQSMTLVLLSYNRGAESVRGALRQLRETDRNYERNFWTLFANRDKLDENFRKESANYVPGFFAVAIIGENPETFELGTPPLSSLAQ